MIDRTQRRTDSSTASWKFGQCKSKALRTQHQWIQSGFSLLHAKTNKAQNKNQKKKTQQKKTIKLEYFVESTMDVRSKRCNTLDAAEAKLGEDLQGQLRHIIFCPFLSRLAWKFPGGLDCWLAHVEQSPCLLSSSHILGQRDLAHI